MIKLPRMGANAGGVGCDVTGVVWVGQRTGLLDVLDLLADLLKLYLGGDHRLGDLLVR